MNRVVVVGRGRAGKTTSCKILARLTPLRYSKSTSELAADIVYDYAHTKEGLERFGRAFASLEECWMLRGQYRQIWADVISNYNNPNSIRIYEEAFKNQDIIDRVCRVHELEALRRHVDLVVWIERDIPEDPSMEFGQERADMVVYNNGTLDDLERRLLCLAVGLS